MNYVLKMSFHFENINLIGKCYEGLLLYSPTTTQHNFLFLKIPILVTSRISDGLMISIKIKPELHHTLTTLQRGASGSSRNFSEQSKTLSLTRIILIHFCVRRLFHSRTFKIWRTFSKS